MPKPRNCYSEICGPSRPVFAIQHGWQGSHHCQWRPYTIVVSIFSHQPPVVTTTLCGFHLLVPAIIYHIDSHHCTDHRCCLCCETHRLLPHELCTVAYHVELPSCQLTKQFHISCYWTANSHKHTLAILIGKEFLLLTRGSLRSREGLPSLFWAKGLLSMPSP